VAVFKTILYVGSVQLYCYCVQTGYWMWLCLKLYCMYVVCSYIVIVYRRGIESGCV